MITKGVLPEIRGLLKDNFFQKMRGARKQFVKTKTCAIFIHMGGELSCVIPFLGPICHSDLDVTN